MEIYEKAKPLGGVSLNYEVVGGTAPPTNFKKENTLWVDTDVEIAGHAFEYNAPNYLTPNDIWIQTDIDRASIGFNAIKKNELMVYPYKLHRWNGSSWQILGGILYQNGKAAQSYDNTVQFYPGATVYSTSGTSDIHDKDGFHIWQKSSSTNDNTAILYIEVDVTNINTLTVTGHFGVTNTNGYVGIWLHNSITIKQPYYTIGQGSDPANYTLMQRITGASNTQKDPTTYDIITPSFSFDVSGLTGIYYLHLGGYANCTSSSYPVLIDGNIETVTGK